MEHYFIPAQCWNADILLLTMNKKQRSALIIKKVGSKAQSLCCAGGSRRKKGFEFEFLGNYHHKGPAKVTLRMCWKDWTKKKRKKKNKFPNRIVFDFSTGTTERVKFVCRSLVWDTLHCSHDLWAVKQRMRLQIQAGELRFLRRDRERSSDIWSC